ncbi:MAG: DUF1801 domain-containing protein [Bacteroidota bacterium]
MRRIPSKITSIVQLYDVLPEQERRIVDVLRQLIIETLPARCKEKISYNVPFFYGNRGICIVWPATIPRGGIKSGVLLGFWHGNKLKDVDRYLTRSINKQVFYKVYQSVYDIDKTAVVKLLKEAAVLDARYLK